MATYINQPTIATNFLAPERASFDVKGSALDGGRNGLGDSIAIETTGGGIVTATYEDCKIKDKEQYEYINWLGARLNGSFRFINVEIPTDWFGPFPTIGGLPTPIVSGIPHSDGSTFDDGSGYSQATVWGRATQFAALNAGVINIQVSGMVRRLRHSDWFSIYHPTKGWRAYRYWDVLDAPSSGNNGTYRLAISPPLREAVTTDTRIEFARPRFVAKFPSEFTLPSVLEAFFVTKQTIQFSEAF